MTLGNIKFVTEPARYGLLHADAGHILHIPGRDVVMLKQTILLSTVLFLANNGPGCAQGMFENNALRALSAGGGAGTAAAVAGKTTQSGKKSSLTPAMSRELIQRNAKSGEQFQKAGKLADAERCYRTALTGLGQSMDFDSEDGMRVLQGLTEVCAGQHKIADAAGFSNTWVGATKKKFGDDDNRTITAKHHAADVLTEKGDHQGAAKHLGEALQSAQKQPNFEPGKMIEMLDSYAIVLRKLGRETEANQVEKQATDLYAGKKGD